MLETKQRTIKLHCPVASKTVDTVVWEHERVDLGSIARAFGLDPQSVKLNRHFIAGGLSHVASSVTWKSLLSCFSSKRLSGAIVVDGKLSRVGTKRGIGNISDSEGGSGSTNTDLVKKRIKVDHYSGDQNRFKLSKGLGFKRKKLLLDGLSLLKRLKINETCSDIITANNQNGAPKNISKTNLRCGPVTGIKRRREAEGDDEIMAVSYKKVL